MNLFDVCAPRQDVLLGSVKEESFAADLAQVLRNQGPLEYRDPKTFFANTHPTQGLKNLLRHVCARLSGHAEQVASVLRLDTQYGGGKTHALIALVHLLRKKLDGVNVEEFIAPSMLPPGNIRIAGFDGENADPANGRDMGEGIKAYTPWGELAYALAGKQGYESIRRSDETGVAPGAENIRALFGGEPTLILLDELSIFLRRAKPIKNNEKESLADQLTPFLTTLFKAVEGTPNAVVVFTLAIGKEDGKATDAYAQENLFIAARMAEAESVAARKATVLNPTEEGETTQVLRRRLFERIDQAKAEEIIGQYRQLWEEHKAYIASAGADRLETFRHSYPLHPELIATLTNKVATLNNFQRIRGMLRLLVSAVANLWEKRPSDAYAVHLHHLDLAVPNIRNEVVVRLEQKAYLPAIRADIDAAADEPPSLAAHLDKQHHSGLPGYCQYVARTAFWHSLVFQEPLKGATSEELRYAIISPGADLSFIDAAAKKFVAESAYLDDKPGVPLRFLSQPNINQLIRQQEKNIEDGVIRAELRDRIKQIFQGPVFTTIFFPSSPAEVPDDGGKAKPLLVVLSYEAASIAYEPVKVPELVERMFANRGSGNDFRHNKNHLVFLLADQQVQSMYDEMKRRLALRVLHSTPNNLEKHQQEKIRGMYQVSEQAVAAAIQQCYRHVFYPSDHCVPGCKEKLAHCVIELTGASEKPGAGQKQVVEKLRGNKLRLAEDAPDSPNYIRDKTPLKKGRITTAGLLAEYRQNTGLPILVSQDVLLKGIRQGVEDGKFVYQCNDLIFAKGLHWAEIHIEENAFVYTAEYARDYKIWPKPEVVKPPTGIGDPSGGTGGGTGGDTAQSQSKPNTISAEGVLREALIALWEKARKAEFGAIGELRLRLSELVDVARLAVELQRLPDSTSRIALESGYDTQDDSHLELKFNGSLKEVRFALDFFKSQSAPAKHKDLDASFSIQFSNGLPLQGNAPEQLAENLSRYAAGAAFVQAWAMKKE